MAKTVETFVLTIAGKPFQIAVGDAFLLTHMENGPVAIVRLETIADAEFIEKTLVPKLGNSYEWRVASDPAMAISMDVFVATLTKTRRYFTSELDRGRVIHARSGQDVTYIPILS